MKIRWYQILLTLYKLGETGEEVALRYGITRQRVEQIERKILTNPTKIRELDVYREELGIRKSYYISDIDNLNVIVDKLINRIKSKEINKIKLFSDLKFSFSDKLYFILRYGFEMGSVDIYKYNLKNEEDGTKKHIGFVIGDNYKYSKELTSNNNDGVDIYSLASCCLAGIKEQQKIIETLQQEIKELKEVK